MSPNVFIAEAGCLKVKEPLSMAVCIMMGIITECAVISDGCTGGPDNKKVVHKVSIAPFRQEFRRDTTMWGRVLKFNSLSCGISTEGISFTTRPRTLSAPIFASSSSMSCLSLLVIAFLNYSFVQMVLHRPLPKLQERVVHVLLL